MFINWLKISSITFLMFANIQMVFSQQSLSISGKYENGETVNENNIFMLNDRCRFFIEDEDGNKKDLISSVWRFECLDNDSTYMIDREITDNSDLVFLLDDLHVDSISLKRIKVENDNSVLFQAKISCVGQTSSCEDFSLSFPVFLNLLPAVPVINSKFTINLKEKKVDINLKLFSDRADRCELVQKEYEHPYINTWIYPNCSEFNYIYYDYIDSVVFRAYSRNKFGISDTRIIKFTYADLLTGIDEIDRESEPSFYPNPFNDVLRINGEYRDIEKVIITDIGGRMAKTINNVETPTIQVADLLQGMYIITISQKQNSKNKSFKLIKK